MWLCEFYPQKIDKANKCWMCITQASVYVMDWEYSNQKNAIECEVINNRDIIIPILSSLFFAMDKEKNKKQKRRSHRESNPSCRKTNTSQNPKS